MLHMLQPTYIKSMLVRYGMQDSRPASTQLLESNFAHLEAEEDTTVGELNLYQQTIGSLLYLALKTRPDILTAVCIRSRFTSAPTKYCHMAVKRVFRYLQGTVCLALVYCSSDIKMVTCLRTRTMQAIRTHENRPLEWHFSRIMLHPKTMCPLPRMNTPQRRYIFAVTHQTL
jgi:hypothetical protein